MDIMCFPHDVRQSFESVSKRASNSKDIHEINSITLKLAI